MSLKEKIKELYPGIKTEYLPDFPSPVVKVLLEQELKKEATPEGFEKVKSIVETEHNLLESRRQNSLNPKSETEIIRSYTFMNNPSSGHTPS